MCDIENKADALILRAYDPEFNAEACDYIRAVGVVETYFSETNSNEEESTPIVAAYEYDEISYEEAVSPELIKKDPDKKYLRPIYYMK